MAVLRRATVRRVHRSWTRSPSTVVDHYFSHDNQTPQSVARLGDERPVAVSQQLGPVDQFPSKSSPHRLASQLLCKGGQQKLELSVVAAPAARVFLSELRKCRVSALFFSHQNSFSSLRMRNSKS